MVDCSLIQAWGSAGGLLAAESQGSFWMPPARSTAAPAVDHLFYLILYVSTFFFALIVGAMILFVIRYRRRPGYVPAESANHNTLLEIVWTAVPVVIVAFIFYQGFVTYFDMRNAPSNALGVNVTARQWSWSFQYDNGVDSPELHVPVGEPVSLRMQSQDVIHSLFVPHFRLKADVVPGRYTRTWFVATEPGTYDLYCAEYCGAAPQAGSSGEWPGHFSMATKVVVHPPGEFRAWLDEELRIQQTRSPAEWGKKLYVSKGCVQCHTIDGGVLVGPSFKGIWHQTHTFSNAPPTLVDDNYILESIRDPAAKIREGFPPKMNSYKGMIKDAEINALIAFIRSLGDEKEKEEEKGPEKEKSKATGKEAGENKKP